jgi:hypothetical protein
VQRLLVEYVLIGDVRNDSSAASPGQVTSLTGRTKAFLRDSLSRNRVAGTSTSEGSFVELPRTAVPPAICDQQTLVLP